MEFEIHSNLCCNVLSRRCCIDIDINNYSKDADDIRQDFFAKGVLHNEHRILHLKLNTPIVVQEHDRRIILALSDSMSAEI